MPKDELYEITGKGITTIIHTSPSREKFWLLPGALVALEEADGLKRYRRRAFDLRKAAIRKEEMVPVGDFYVVRKLIIFDSISAATSFVLGSSRSGDVAKSGKRRALVGKNLVGEKRACH